MGKEDLLGKVLAALITAAAMIIVAIIGLYGVKLQTEIPLRATLTFRAPTVVVSVVTLDNPSFFVENRLWRPIKVYIDGEYVGEVDKLATKYFLLKGYPVKVQWKVVKTTVKSGREIGHDMVGTFDEVQNHQHIVVDSVVSRQPYFYPVLTNNTENDCTIIVNESWESEYDTGATIKAHRQKVEIGYYLLYTNSNVLLKCDGKLYWWGLRADESRGHSFYEDVEEGSGVIYFTLNP